MLRILLPLLLLSSPVLAAPLIEAEPAATIDRLDAGETPEGVHLVWARVLRRATGEDGAPRTWVKLLRPVRKGKSVVFRPSKHKVEFVGWLPRGPVWQLPVAWDAEGRIWQAWDEGIDPIYLDPQNLPPRVDAPEAPTHAWLGNAGVASRLVFETLYDEFRYGKPTTVGTVAWLARVRRVATRREPGEVELARVAQERATLGVVPLWPGEWKLTIGRCDAESMTNAGSVDPVAFTATFESSGKVSVSKIETMGLTRDASAHGFLRLLDAGSPLTPAGTATLQRSFGLSVWQWEEDGDEGAIFAAILGGVLGGTFIPRAVSEDCTRVLAP